MLLERRMTFVDRADNGEKVLCIQREETSSTGQEPIADTAHRLQKYGFGGIVLNITAQPDHKVVDGPGVSIFMDPPDLLQQFFARDNAALIEYQVAEQVALHQSQVDGFVRSSK